MMTILQKKLGRSLQFMHSRRRMALWRAVEGLLLGGRLWLTALGRDLPGKTSDKHRIKAADRLLGNTKLHGEISKVYTGLAQFLLKRIRHPTIAVDWTGVGARHYALSAKLCYQGRCLPLYTEVHPKKKEGNPKVHKKFLKKLADILPAGCKPILTTDAGFHSTWFDAVRARGWDFVGRVRGAAKARINGRWVAIKSLHKLAKRYAQNLGDVLFGRNRPRKYRLVLAKKPKLKGRTRKTRAGKKGHRSDDRRLSKLAREPWLLATSLTCHCNSVVRVYALRMQIEESFRDEKNHRYGWSLSDVRSTSAKRIEVLLLVAALAMIVVHIVGRAAETLELHYAFQANTIKKRRVLSLFVLGCLIIARGCHTRITTIALNDALHQIRETLAKNSPMRGRK